MFYSLLYLIVCPLCREELILVLPQEAPRQITMRMSSASRAAEAGALDVEETSFYVIPPSVKPSAWKKLCYIVRTEGPLGLAYSGWRRLRKRISSLAKTE